MGRMRRRFKRLRALYQRSPLGSPPVRRTLSDHRAVVVGPFSFPDWSATFGDTGAMRVAASWFKEAGIPYDIACDPINGYAEVDIKELDPWDYSIFAYVCGPWMIKGATIFFVASATR